MRTIAEYEAWLASQNDPALLRAEALERMRINVGLIAENQELRRKADQFDQAVQEAMRRRLEQGQ